MEIITLTVRYVTDGLSVSIAVVVNGSTEPESVSLTGTGIVIYNFNTPIAVSSGDAFGIQVSNSGGAEFTGTVNVCVLARITT